MHWIVKVCGRTSASGRRPPASRCGSSPLVKHVPPLSPGDVKRPPAAVAGAAFSQNQRRIAVDRGVLELGPDQPRMRGQRPCDPERQVDQVHAPVDQLSLTERSVWARHSRS
jgi:hypothetical protein